MKPFFNKMTSYVFGAIFVLTLFSKPSFNAFYLGMAAVETLIYGVVVVFLMAVVGAIYRTVKRRGIKYE
jgi:ABC-type polysaccharide/polyol phosphate export permease